MPHANIKRSGVVARRCLCAVGSRRCLIQVMGKTGEPPFYPRRPTGRSRRRRPRPGDLNCIPASVDAPSDSFVDIAHLYIEQQLHAHVLQLLQTFSDSPWRRVRVNMNL
jgi:hypothetical protein